VQDDVEWLIKRNAEGGNEEDDVEEGALPPKFCKRDEGREPIKKNIC